MADRRMSDSFGAGGSGKSDRPGGRSPEPASRWGIPLIFLAVIFALWLGFRLVPDTQGLLGDIPFFSPRATPTLTIGPVSKVTPTPANVPPTSSGQGAQASPAPRSAVPDLTQLSEERAVALLGQHRLTANIVQVFNENVAPGRVVSQLPERNTEVDAGTAVTIRISKGPENPTMPDVVGITVDNAREQLVLLSVTVNVDEQGSDTVDAGIVLAQEPPAGTQVESGSTVRLIVSNGVDRVTVPDVRGKLFAIAAQELIDNGLRGLLGIALTDDPGTCGTVASQNPLPGSEFERNYVVTLTIRSVPGCKPS